jgi:Tfp pilus assembly protein FimT
MRKMQVALAAVLFALATPAFAQVVKSADGHYYRLVPLRHERFATARAEAVQPVAPTSSCHIVPAQTNPYCPPDCQWTTACGPM